MHREIVEVAEDLRRQLAGRRQHQRARDAARLAGQLVQDRQQKCRGLAAAGAGAGQQIASFERGRYGVSLDRGGAGEPEVFQSAEKIGMELQSGEWHARGRRYAASPIPRRAGTCRSGIGAARNSRRQIDADETRPPRRTRHARAVGGDAGVGVHLAIELRDQHEGQPVAHRLDHADRSQMLLQL